MSAGKSLPPPGGGNELEEMLRRRRVRTSDEPPAPEPAPEPVRPAAVGESRPRRAGMDRRSWYMSRLSADALAATVEDLHYATRQPKHVVLSELVAVALEHVAEVERRLRRE